MFTIIYWHTVYTRVYVEKFWVKLEFCLSNSTYTRVSNFGPNIEKKITNSAYRRIDLYASIYGKCFFFTAQKNHNNGYEDCLIIISLHWRNHFNTFNERYYAAKFFLSFFLFFHLFNIFFPFFPSLAYFKITKSILII